MMTEQTLPEWALVQKTYKDCPNCENGKLDIRIRRSTLVKTFLFFIDLRRYECSCCGHKAYVTNKQLS